MEPQNHLGSEQRTEAEQPTIEHYLPAGPRLSTERGFVERFLTTLFRRRGGYRVIARRAGR